MFLFPFLHNKLCIIGQIHRPSHRVCVCVCVCVYSSVSFLIGITWLITLGEGGAKLIMYFFFILAQQLPLGQVSISHTTSHHSL